MDSLSQGSAQRLVIGMLTFCLAAAAGMMMTDREVSAQGIVDPQCMRMNCPAGFGCSNGQCIPPSDTTPASSWVCGDGICSVNEDRVIACPDCAAGTPPEQCRCTKACEADCGMAPIPVPPASSSSTSSSSSSSSIDRCMTMNCPDGYGCNNGLCVPPSDIIQAPFTVDVSPPVEAVKVDGATASFWLKLSSWWNRLFSGDN